MDHAPSMTGAGTGDVALADVALPVPVPKAFSYTIPPGMEERVSPGVRAICPFGSRRMIGVVLSLRRSAPPDNVRSLLEVVDRDPAVPADLLAFVEELANYYLCAIGDVMRLALPPVDREVRSRIDGSPAGRGKDFVQWAVPVAKTDLEREPAPDLSGQAAEILTYLQSDGAVTIAALTKRWNNARRALRRLVERNLARIEMRVPPEPAPFRDEQPRDSAPCATEAQDEALAHVGAALSAAGPATFLLHGVTGSGKTEVYLRAIAKARELGRGAIVLVPEIALTPQLVDRYRARFGDDVAVLHSGLTRVERHQMWQRLHSGGVSVAIGARSALFAPVPKLGLVIVDEEHDPSFKQEDGVRYHARDMAILRAHRASGVCVLGSATPSLESEWLARTGKAKKLLLPARARAQAMPTIELVDLRTAGPGPTGDKRISLPLHRAIEQTLGAGEQAILFLNRRGFAPSVRCTACGQVLACSSCSVALTYHRRSGGTVCCHYCDFARPMPGACDHCGHDSLLLEGLGTEKLEDAVSAAFPTARVARLDRDVASAKTIADVLARMRGRDIDILVGTQMVTKSHDLPHVTLVGVINADAALSIPDFRAAERGFQLLVQVAGRAGRGGTPGRVLLQTYNPRHPAIVHAATHDVPGFLDRELADRRELGYPPFSRVGLVRTDAFDEAAARAACRTMARLAHEMAARSGGTVEVVGPAPAPLARLRSRFRFHLLLRSTDRQALRRVLRQLAVARAALPRSVKCCIDVDPVQLL